MSDLYVIYDKLQTFSTTLLGNTENNSGKTNISEEASVSQTVSESTNSEKEADSTTGNQGILKPFQ